VLDKLHTETLQDLYLAQHPEEKGNKLKKGEMLTAIADSIEEASVRCLVAALSRDDMKKLLEKLSVDFKGDNKNSKQVLTRRLTEQIGTAGIDDFLKDNADDAVLDSILADLDLDKKGKKEDTIALIASTVRNLGMESFFSSFDVDSLHDICQDLKVKTHNSNNKRKLVEGIVKQEDLDKEEPKKKKQKVKVSSKKKDIKKGVTFDDIFQHYYVDEVRDWCKEHGLKTTGKKTVLIKRIVAFLDGDEETTKAKPRAAGKGKGKGKKSSGKGKGKGKAKDKDSKENGGEEKKTAEEPKKD